MHTSLHRGLEQYLPRFVPLAPILMTCNELPTSAVNTKEGRSQFRFGVSPTSVLEPDIPSARLPSSLAFPLQWVVL